VVYVRQSTQTQVQTNLESQRRQYDLVEVARRHGFIDIEVIDDDLGRSASGSVDRSALSGSSLSFALKMSAQCCAWMLRGCRATVETGIICLSCVVWSKRG
jgi:hypothetical protein